MSPVVDCDTDEDVDTKMLTMPVSPFSESDNADEAVCSSLSAINRLSSSFPSCSLSRALRDVQPDDMQVDPLSMSCFAELRLDRLSDDGDLTSLDWLQDINLLRNISPDVRPNSDPSMLVDDAHKENAQVSCYHPKHNPCGKPPYSFSVLIFMAIESSPQRRLPVKQIYEWIANQFPFYRRAPLGWRNSVRHNLSLNKCFRKVEKACGKGSSWCVDPFFRPNLLQAMKRTPYFPYQQIQMTSVATAEVLLDNCFTDLNSEECETTAAVGMPCDVDMDVAATLASLGSVRVTSLLSERDRKLLKIRSVRNLPELVCTPPPYKDHVYGFAESLVVEAQQAALTLDCDMESPVDEVYDFGEICCESEVSDSTEALSDEDSDSSRSRRHSIISRRCWMMPEDVADEEEQRRLEGVRALLNLASGTKGDRQKKARSLSLSRSLWAKAGNTTRLKKQRKNRKQLGKVQTNKSLHKMKGKRKVVRRRTR